MKDTKSLVTGHKATGNCAKGHTSVAFTYDRYGHLLPEIDKQAATKLEILRERHSRGPAHKEG